MSISRYWSFFTTLLFIVVHSERDSFGLKRLGENQLTSVYFIGDLHADVVCVQQWMNATRLIDFSESSYKWTGGADEAIVFMGDYVDKGSTSSSVLSFMKELQETFPDNVITLLGNHDIYLILDTVLEFNKNNPHPLGRPKYEYTYGWMHVEEYTESDFTTKREGDEELLGAILQGLQHAYDLDREKELYLCAPRCLDESQIDLFTTVSPFVDNQTLAIRAKERLEIWRKEYAEGMYNSGLLAWLIKQPLVAHVGDALVVHGGVSEHLINKFIGYNNGTGLENGMSITSALHQGTNEAFAKFFELHSSEMTGANTIKSRDFEGINDILGVVRYRGYFEQNGCEEVNTVLAALGGNDAGFGRVVVGHTPFYFAAQHCDGQLLAADSRLSRYYRAHGNLYCPLSKALDQYRGSSICEVYHKDTCEGSITRMRRTSAQDPWPKDMEMISVDGLIMRTPTEVSDDVEISDDVEVSDDMEVSDNVEISGDFHQKENIGFILCFWFACLLWY